MVFLEEGTYENSRSDDQLLSMEGSSAVIGRFGGVEEWQLKNSDGTVSLRDTKSQSYLSSADSENPYHQPIQLGEEQHWRLTEGESPGKVFIEHPSPEEDGTIYVIDIGPLRIFPPRLNLMRKEGPHQAWLFKRIN
ncbi:hypothetical protein BGX27_002590 [Mortierella sp. AM989]|nr:hypothetical protein BGX27_002590 [Mortierella sp. AM989]